MVLANRKDLAKNLVMAGRGVASRPFIRLRNGAEASVVAWLYRKEEATRLTRGRESTSVIPLFQN